MLKVVDMPEVKTVFLEGIDKLYSEALRKIMDAAIDAEPGKPLDEETLSGVIAVADPHEFACNVEKLLDDAIELGSTTQEAATPHVVGKLEKFTLKDSFALAIDVSDCSENSALLYAMKQEGWVRIESVQGVLALDDGEPDTDTAETGGQMDLGDGSAEQPEEPENPEDGQD